MQVRCLHCHEPIEVADDSDFSQLSCSSCGGSFSLVGERTVTYEGAKARTLGHFELIDQVGAGAFGTVWKARDTELDRTVAVKVPRKGELDPEESELFLREARAAAQLRHPNIVGVHEVGRDDDSVYIVSDFVEGATLDDWLTGQQLTSREAAELVAKIAEALEHAHEAGVIHRDLKPGNIMLDLDGEPHLMDFGLARRVAGEVTMTVAGRVLGTPAYMSPEQARGEGHHADRRTDIYSTGVVLFKLLTGELPFRGNPQMLIVQIQREEPPSPRKLNSRIPRDLETICLKCLEKNPERRYATASELAADLHRWLEGEPIHARPIGSAARAWRWCRRKPAVASLTATAALLLLAVAVVTTVGYLQVRGALRRESDALADAQDERDAAVEAREAANRSQKAAETARASEAALKEQFRRQLYVSDMNLASQAYEDGSIERMNDLLEKHRPQPGTSQEDLRGFEWFYWWRAGRLHQGRLRNPTTGPFRQVAISPDGKVGAALGFPRTIYVFDCLTLRLLHSPIDVSSEFNILAVSPDGAYLLDGAPFAGRIRVFRTSDWQLAQTLRPRGGTACFAFSPDGSRMASAGRGQQIFLWDIATFPWKRAASWPAHGFVRSLAFSRDGNRLVAGMDEKISIGGTEPSSVVVWDVEKQNVLATLPNHKKQVCSVAYSTEGSILAVGGEERLVRLWNSDLQEQASLSTNGPVLSLVFSSDGKRLVAGTGGTNSVLVWDVSSQSSTPLHTIQGHSRQVEAVAFVADSQRIASAGEDGFVKFWDLTRRLPYDTPPDASPATPLGYADGDILVYLDAQGMIRRWSVGGREPLDPLETARYAHAAASCDGATLAGVTPDGELRVWESATGRRLFTQPNCSDVTPQLAVTRDGRTSAWTTPQGAVLLDCQSGKRTQIDDAWVLSDRAPIFSPDGKSMALQRRFDGTDFFTFVYDLTTDAPTRQHALSGWGPETSATFSPNGNLLAIGSYNHMIRLHDTDTGELLDTLPGHTGQVLSLAFSGDRTLVSGGSDGTVRIWDAVAGQLLSTLQTHDADVRLVALSPSGDSIASRSGDGTLKLWRTATLEETEQDVDDRMDRATDHVLHDRIDRAIEELTEALRLFPDNGWALEFRGYLNGVQRDWSAALADYTAAIDVFGHDVSLLEARAEVYRKLGRRAEALRDSFQALALNPTEADLDRVEGAFRLGQPVVPTAADWQFTTTPPSEDWQEAADFDDSRWLEGPAPLGSYEETTRWSASDPEIWMRHEFELQRGIEAPLVLSAYVDDAAEFYLNGTLVARGAWVGSRYQTLALSKDARLRAGKNVLAIHARNDSEGSKIDVGLYLHSSIDFNGALIETAASMSVNWQQRRRFGAILARRQRWPAAGAFYKAAVQVQADIPADENQLTLGWSEGAAVLFQSGDLDGYRGYCRKMLDRFQATSTPFVAERVAKACLFAPPDASLRDAALTLADRSVTLDETHWVVPWAQMVKGLAEYRRGHFTEALAWSERCLSHGTGEWYRAAQAYFVQAMAYGKLDQMDQAREALKNGAGILEQQTARYEAEGFGDFTNWVYCRALLAEAQGVLRPAVQ